MSPILAASLYVSVHRFLVVFNVELLILNLILTNFILIFCSARRGRAHRGSTG